MMETVTYAVVTLLVATILFFGLRYFIRAYVRYRDSRMIICPDNNEAVIVEVDAIHAALTSAVGEPDIRLQNCGRWPLHRSCGQGCLVQLDIAPTECLVRGVLKGWYDSKDCIYCGKWFDQIQFWDHKPALQSPNGALVEWKDVEITDLENVLKNYHPVCWDCQVTHSFLQEHPELVVYRPWKSTTVGRNY